MTKRETTSPNNGSHANDKPRWHRMDNGKSVWPVGEAKYLADNKFGTEQAASNYHAQYDAANDVQTEVLPSRGGQTGTWYLKKVTGSNSATSRIPAAATKSTAVTLSVNGVALNGSKGKTLARLLDAARKAGQWVTGEYLARIIDVPLDKADAENFVNPSTGEPQTQHLPSYLGTDMNAKLGHGFVSLLLDSGARAYTIVLPTDVEGTYSKESATAANAKVLALAIKSFPLDVMYGDEPADDEQDNDDDATNE